jgi:predicted TIM-barrel fold metal-dependent hydrolase
LDRVVLLAFDAVYDEQGRFDDANTHLFVTNNYVAELVKQYPQRLLMGASVHPYRKDAARELERAIAMGAALCKWLPIVQNFDPADARCYPLYEILAHHRVPLLSHTGGEQSLPNLRRDVADPRLLEPALERGVTVIAAHCGTRSRPGETDFLRQWTRMALEHENFYGDTAALNLPTRSYAWKTLLADERLRKKLLHGSDWPILPLPPLRVGLGRAARLLRDLNWIRRDLQIKRALGLGEDYFARAAGVVRLPG